MVDKTQNWSSSWKSSTNQSKQRKYRENAPMHVRDKFISANLNQTLRDELGVRSLGIRVGDRAKVMRGDDKGVEGIVSNIDRQEEKIYINNLDRQKIDGTMKEKPFNPSNLQLQALNLEDDERIEKYDVDDFSGIEVEEEELEELEEEDEENEMMQKMQQQGQPTDFDTEDESEEAEESAETESETGSEASEEKSVEESAKEEEEKN